MKATYNIYMWTKDYNHSFSAGQFDFDGTENEALEWAKNHFSKTVRNFIFIVKID